MHEDPAIDATPAPSACVVIPLFHTHRDELHLSPAAARWVFSDLMLKLGMRMPADHLELFLKRRYRDVAAVRRVLTRYKVFGDLGYGADADSSP